MPGIGMPIFLQNWYIRQYLHTINSTGIITEKNVCRANAFRIYPIHNINDCLNKCILENIPVTFNTVYTKSYADYNNLYFTEIPRTADDVIHYITWPDGLRAELSMNGVIDTNFDGVFKYGLPIVSCPFFTIGIYFYDKMTNKNVPNVQVYSRVTLLPNKLRIELSHLFMKNSPFPLILNNNKTFNIHLTHVVPGANAIKPPNVNVYPQWYHDLVKSVPIY